MISIFFICRGLPAKELDQGKNVHLFLLGTLSNGTFNVRRTIYYFMQKINNEQFVQKWNDPLMKNNARLNLSKTDF